MSSSNAVQVIKQIVMETMKASQGASTIIGKVINVTPLSVQIGQQIILPESFLVVPEKLTDYQMEISFDDGSIIQGLDFRKEPDPIEYEWNRNELRFSPPVRHKITIYNALKTGDMVSLSVQNGGQQYFILDRLAVKK